MATTSTFRKNPQFDQQFQKELINMLENISVAISDEARRLSPVDTGALRGSIKFEINEPDLSTVIKTDGIDYAVYQELGTRKMQANPYMRPALDYVLSQID
jgi:HK97 gp10 family phage protein